jgi:hypothetical protein
MFVLFDSRSRNTTGKRHAWEFPETPEGVHALWDLVLMAEVPGEYDDYAYLAETRWHEAIEVFNDYWAIYGWYVNAFEDDWAVPDDVEVRRYEPPHTP